MHLGIEAAELGESPPSEARSLLQVLPSQEYFWIVSQFLEFLYERPYRGRLLPLLLRALPVENLAPTHIQSALLLLHYLLDSWPVHFWIALEHLQPALEEDSLWSHPSYAPARQWEAQLIRGAVWEQEASREQTMAFLRAFFEMAKDYFQPHRYPGRHDTPLARHIAPAALPIAQQLRPAAQEELVAPRPWEDLASFVGRAARAMCYEFPDWALISPEPPRRKVYSRELPLLHRLADYQVIERALGLGEAELHHMTLHRFAARLQSPERGARAPSSYPAGESIDRPLLSRSTVRRLDISLRSTKICPGCLDEVPAYDRLFWRLRSVILCPYHALLLLDRCLYCSAPISGLRRSPGRCPYCRGEYLQAPRALIAPTSWLYEGQTLLLHQLTAENANGWTGVPAFAGSPILRIEPWHYFALLERFENLLQPRLAGSIVIQTLKKLAWEDDQSTSQSPVIREVALQMALFHYLLASWPENLLAALDRTHPLLKGQHERRGVLGDSWQAEADRLAQRIRSASIDDDAPFVLLSQVFDTFFTWATLTGIPTRR